MLRRSKLFYREINIKNELQDKISKKYGRFKNIKRSKLFYREIL